MKICTREDWEKNTRQLNIERIKVHKELTSLIKSTLSSGSVLEVGAQSGIDAEYLGACGYDVTAIDYCYNAISILIKRHNIKVLMAEALQLPFKDFTFDLVYSQGLIEHFRGKELNVLLYEQNRVLKNGGYLVIDVPNTYSYLTPIKQILILLNKWIVPWETQYTLNKLKHLGEEHGFIFKSSYSWGYDKYVGEKIRNNLGCFKKIIEKLEKSKGHYFMKCIGALFQKP